jgi:O-antigen ligase
MFTYRKWPMKEKIIRAVQKTKIGKLELGMMLLFVLPPVGIAWLLLMGWFHLYRTIRRRIVADFTVSVFFFLSLLVSSIAASILLHHLTYLLSSIFITGYLGLYLYVRQHGTLYLFRNWIGIIIGGGMYISLLGWVQILFHIGFSMNGTFSLLTGTRLFGYEQLDRLFGSAYNPNFAAFLLLYALALLLVILLYKMHQQRRRLNAIFIVCIFVLSTAIIETGSRTGFAAMLLLFLFFFLRLGWKKGIVGVIVFLLSSPLFIEWLPRTESLGESMSNRKLIWETSVAIWKKYPIFGVTPSGFQDIFENMTGQYIAHPHNILLYFFVNYGTLGGMAFLLMIVVLLYRLLFVLTTYRTHKEFLDMFSFLIPVTLLTGMFDYPMFSPQTALLAIGLLGHWEYYSRMCSFAPWTIKRKVR